MADHQLSRSCRDDYGEKGGVWHPTWELMMVLGLEFLAWVLQAALSLLLFPLSYEEAIIAEVRMNLDT